MSTKIRVRFAPSPTGFMHLGNVRAALLNYLFAKKYNGTFILRIEDTDNARNTQESLQQIIEDLKWLSLTYDEGPQVGGHFGPYFQSERSDIYQEKLLELVNMNRVYRCFCTTERLELMREKQLAMKKPPRYDRTCLNLSTEHIQQKLAASIPFIWRFKINEHQSLQLNNVSLAPQLFNMQHFADFAMTRQDGSFTFIFSNFIDDVMMEITHVIRGEDHLSNTALQLAMYDAFALQAPTFLHLPMICNSNGEKLSKRDFGFALRDLQAAGFLPQAICNYLTIIGTSVEEEVQSLVDLIKNSNFSHTPGEGTIAIPAGGAIKYDLEKLRWINHQWIQKMPFDQLCNLIKPQLFKEIPESKNCNREKLEALVKLILPELKTTQEAVSLMRFYFKTPQPQKSVIVEQIKDKTDQVLDLIKKHTDKTPMNFLTAVKEEGKLLNLGLKPILSTVRYLLTEQFEGLGINDLVQILDPEVFMSRLKLTL